ncbi:voltage-gated chloride channel family protein [Paenibacillus sp. GSMTC-2017]|uniref:voltage-gated chloride channel family protein n=1 Tax=Paenibacillus sp. GSMTC-2017 TaxID=2794350 RepID=UPI0018DA240D|nr:voltage-gated chloride channel family protein [Paenibacillus sp. GSMTC-2017]MBH5317717.1 voltage-gated chloride channel family protein [Paenibacillus sp. GSMTC-2017]
MKQMKWLLLPIAVGASAGTVSALFLVSLDFVTSLQTSHVWLLWLLPFGGALVSYIYMKYGKDAGRGNNLVIEQIHSGSGSVPLRMAPLVLFGTLLTHLFGGSAGREGTAVQLGSSLSASIGKLFKLKVSDQRLIVLLGVSAGFASVFGTPLAGTLFGLEVSTKGSLRFRALLPCLVASYMGHYVTLSWGIEHSHYVIGVVPGLDWLVIAKVTLAAIIFGVAASLFVHLTSTIKKRMTQVIAHPVLRSFVGGCMIIALVLIIGSRDYLGLGLPLMDAAFNSTVSFTDSILKMLFTAVTLGTGFIGGEVTPLFVIGSTLGSALSAFLSLSAPFLAALGLVSIFGAASKTPLACIVLGLELFGWDGALYFILACYISNLISGRSNIYEAHIRNIQPKR